MVWFCDLRWMELNRFLSKEYHFFSFLNLGIMIYYFYFYLSNSLYIKAPKTPAVLLPAPKGIGAKPSLK